MPADGTDAMRTRSFIGLVLLVAILMVVSVPALLTPAAAGVENGLVKAGLLNDEERAFEQQRKIDASQTKEPVEERMMLKGHLLDEETGNLRDTVTVDKRTSNERGRLAEGDRRVLLPGQLSDQDAYSLPPVATEGAMVLDDTGCPVVPDGQSLSALFEDPAVRRAYQKKANGADDPSGCAKSINERLKADQDTVPLLLPNDRRRLSSMTRRDSTNLQLSVYMETMYEQLFGATMFDSANATGTIAQELRRG